MTYVVYTFAVFGFSIFLVLLALLGWLVAHYDEPADPDDDGHDDTCPCDRCQDSV